MAVDIIGGLDKIQKSALSKPGVQLNAGGYKVSVAVLHHGKPANEYPIGQFLQRIYIFEDIEKFGITGWIEMLDVYNLVRNGIILGEELLYLQFSTAGTDLAGIEDDWAVDFTDHPLYVHKVENMKETKTSSGKPGQSGLTYRLHFCSPELLRSNRVRISRTLQGTYSDMVKNVLKNDLKTTKELETKETEDLKLVNVPNLSPFDTIRNMVSSCQSTPNEKIFKGRQTDYYFWETSRGYKMLPIFRPHEDNLVFTVATAPATMSFKGEMTTAMQHNYLYNGDTLAGIRAGSWGSKQILYDNTTKSYDLFQSNYHTSLDKDVYAEVSQTPVFVPDSTEERNVYDEPKTISDFPDGRLMFSGWNSNRLTNINKDTNESTHPWVRVPSDISMQRNIQTSQTMAHQLMNIRVHGISRLEAGMTIELQLPAVGRGSGYVGSKETTAPVWEDRHSNIWLIKKLTHAVDLREGQSTYYCDLEISNMMLTQKDPLPTYVGLGSSKY